MEIFVLDENFNSIDMIDSFESLIWTERYNGAGNFEIYSPVSESLLNLFLILQKKMDERLDWYVWMRDSGTCMVIEDMEIKTDVENGNRFILSGRGLESILERRIIWEQTNVSGSLQNGIKKLITDALITPKLAERKIDNFIFKDSTQESITSLKNEAQYTGNNLYDVIYAICEDQKLGFDIDLDQNNKFTFQLYAGENRSYDQEKNPYIIFSTKFENIATSDYLESSKTLRNVTLVAGEDEGNSRRTFTVGDARGLKRRELYTDARDIQSELEDDKVMPPEEYNKLLEQRGKEKLTEHKYTKVFTGEIESTKTFVYGEDFFIGDIVQFVNEYNMESKVRVIEIVRVYDMSGYRVYPTFEVMDKEGDKEKRR